MTIYLKYKKFTRGWFRMWAYRLAYLTVGLLLGGGVVYVSNARLDFNGSYSLERGYYNNIHEFRPFTCEHTKANSDGFTDGVQEFVLTTGPSIGALAKHQSIAVGFDELASPEWHKPTVFIDYLKNHEVCVKNMWIDKSETCFDLYELGER